MVYNVPSSTGVVYHTYNKLTIMEIAIIHNNTLHKLVKANNEEDCCSHCSLFDLCHPINGDKFPCDLSIYDNNKVDYHFKQVNISVIFQ